VLVISDAESLKMLADPHAAALAREGKVLIVVDAASGGTESSLPPEGSQAVLAAAVAQ
jgi:hypothetical protein